VEHRREIAGEYTAYVASYRQYRREKGENPRSRPEPRREEGNEPTCEKAGQVKAKGEQGLG